jgi:hypothetical protein
MSDRPVVRAIVAWPLGNGRYHVRRGDTDATRPLEDALAFADLGFEVIIDPESQEALARYEQLQRINKPRWQRW